MRLGKVEIIWEGLIIVIDYEIILGKKQRHLADEGCLSNINTIGLRGLGVTEWFCTKIELSL